MQHIEEQIFNIKTDKDFEKLALEIFRFQAKENPVYSDFVRYLGVYPDNVGTLQDIPFLPIEFFKTKKIVSRYWKLSDNEFVMFKSSGTTGVIRSKHYIYNINVYEKSYLTGFEKFFGKPSNYVILGLLPSYLEAGNSSLVYMVNDLIKKSRKSDSGFYLYEYDKLLDILCKNEKHGQEMILFGVSYALLDFAEYIGKRNFKHLKIIETGGMKGRKKELVRDELHQRLENAFGVEKIMSEYGMTELLSQAYSMGDGIFNETDTLKILIRDVNDPLSYVNVGKTGGINVIDLSNLYSCSFIATQDLGRKKENGFEVLGRFEESDIRGCNLLII